MRWEAYMDSDDDEPILPQAPRSASTPEPAPASLFGDDDDMDLFSDPPSPVPAVKEFAKIRNLYNGPCPPSPIAPIIMDDQDLMDQWAWEDRQKYRDEQDLIDNNTDALYVSLPLHANITLIDPSSVDLSEDPVDSRINSCNCTDKIVSAKCDLFSSCDACEPKSNDRVKWLMDSGASMAFTSHVEDFSQLTYFRKDKQIPVSTANGIASIVGHGTVFIETKPNEETVITRLHPVFLLPGMPERLLSMGQILHGNTRINGDKNTLTFTNAENGNVVLHAKNSNFMQPHIYWVDTRIVNGSDLTALSSIHEDSYDLWHRRLGHPSDQVLVKFKSKTKNFPSDLRIPKESHICEGCAQGKMHNQIFSGESTPCR